MKHLIYERYTRAADVMKAREESKLRQRVKRRTKLVAYRKQSGLRLTPMDIFSSRKYDLDSYALDT